MSQVGALSIAITADGGQAIRELDNVDKKQKRSMSSIGKGLADNAKQWAKWSAAATAAAAAISTALVRSTMTANRELRAQASAANTTIAELQRYGFASQSVGISQEKFADILKDVNDRVGDFLSTGAGPMADFFENIAPQVGVTAEQFRNLSGPQALQLYVSSLEQANLSQAEMTFYMEAMASDSTRLIPLLRENGQLMGQMAEEAEALGIGLSQVDSDKIERANQALAQARQSSQRLMEQFTVGVSDGIAALAEMFSQASSDTEDFSETVARVFDDMVITGIRVAGALRSAFGVIKEQADSLWRGYTSLPPFVQEIGIIGAMMMGKKGLLAIAAISKTLDLAEQRFLEFEINQTRVADRVSGGEDGGILSRVFGTGESDDWAQTVIDNYMEGVEEIRSRVSASSLPQIRGATMEVQPSDGVEDTESKSDFKYSEQANEEWLNGLRDRMKSEDVLISEHWARQMTRLDEAREQELLTEDEFQRRKTQIDQEAADARQRIADEESAYKRRAMSGMFKQLSGLMNTESRKLFEIGKAAAVANALLEGKEAVISSYKAGARIGGPPVGAAFAAAAAGATFAQIQKIKNSSFNGGGGSGSMAGGGGAAVGGTGGTTQEAPRASTVAEINITGSGNSFSADQVRELIGQINDQVGDGVNLAWNG